MTIGKDTGTGYFCHLLPDVYDKYDLLKHVGITRKQFDAGNDEEMAHLFMRVGWVHDTKLKDKETALPLYYVGMQLAFKCNMEPHKWATLFARVLVILRKNKNYKTELQVLDAVIPRFEYLAKYHKWEDRRKKVLQLMNKKPGLKGFLNSLLSIIY